MPKPKGEAFGPGGQRWLRDLELPAPAKEQLESDLRLLNAAQKELEEHERGLVKTAWKDPRVKLLISMPGVDVTVALSVLAALGDLARFPDADHVAAYLGLVPSTSQSGPHCYHGSITKRGNGKARWLLIQAAQHLAAHPGPLGVFFRRLAKRKGRNIAVVATARKLAVIAWHMLTRNEPYRYAQPTPTQNKLARFRVRATGVKRKTGPGKGSQKPANYGTGHRERTVPSLADVYTAEGLPEATALEHLRPAERRHLGDCRALAFAEAVRQSERVPRVTGKPRRSSMRLEEGA